MGIACHDNRCSSEGHDCMQCHNKTQKPCYFVQDCMRLLDADDDTSDGDGKCGKISAAAQKLLHTVRLVPTRLDDAASTTCAI